MSVHPFVAKVIQKVRLGHPKPIWFDLITRQVPPIDYSAIKCGLPRELVFPEDVAREEFFKAEPLEALRPKSLHEYERNKSAIDVERYVRTRMTLEEQETDAGHLSEETSELISRKALEDFRAARVKQELEDQVAAEQALHYEEACYKDQTTITAEAKTL